MPDDWAYAGRLSRGVSRAVKSRRPEKRKLFITNMFRFQRLNNGCHISVQEESDFANDLFDLDGRSVG